MESFVKCFAKYLFLHSLKITIYQIHVDINNIFWMKGHYIFQSKNSEKNDIVVSFVNLFNVWLNGRQLDSLSTAKVSLLWYYMCSFWKTALLSPKRMKRANHILVLLWKEFWPHRPPARILGSFMDYGLHFKNSYFINIILGLLKNTFKISALLKYTDNMLRFLMCT